MNKSSFFILGQHAVIEALRNPKRKVLRVFLTEESKKNIHRKSPNKNLLDEVKVYFKTKKELDKYSTKENLLIFTRFFRLFPTKSRVAFAQIKYIKRMLFEALLNRGHFPKRRGSRAVKWGGL